MTYTIVTLIVACSFAGMSGPQETLSDGKKQDLVLLNKQTTSIIKAVDDILIHFFLVIARIFCTLPVV